MKYIVLLTLFFAAQAESTEIQLPNEIINKNALLLSHHTENVINSDPFVTVGDQPDCDFYEGSSRIQDAIDSGVRTIKLSGSEYMENLIIENRNVKIFGGYATCSDANNDIRGDGKQIINGANAALPVVRISGNEQESNIIIQNVEITGGIASHPYLSGGISIHEANAYIELYHVNIHNNTGVSGGGLASVRGNVDVEIYESSITNNTANDGGGIYCNGVDTFIRIRDRIAGKSIIAFNEATNGSGGGVYITNDCFFSSLSGTTDFISAEYGGIHDNKASRHGGGVAIHDSGTAYFSGTTLCNLLSDNCSGNTTQPVNINNNEADSNQDELGLGGGIYASGSNAHLELINTVVNDNTAYSGGGIAIENGANLSIQSLQETDPCWNKNGLCSQIKGNHTGQNTLSAVGGGLYVSSGSVATISRTEFSGNRAGEGVAIYNLNQLGDEDPSIIKVDGVLIVKNGDDAQNGWGDFYTIRNEEGIMRINFSTIADNNVNNGSANIFNLGEIEIYNSIIHNTDGLLVLRGDNQGASLFYECLILNELDTLPRETDLDLADPMFVDRLNGDYHLNPALSPAVDFCNEFQPSNIKDVDNETRGIDDPNVQNLRGPFDVGFDETNDFIFRNSF
ncbi:MAG: hypothetical protein R3E90_05990 [Marinicella sp.]